MLLRKYYQSEICLIIKYENYSCKKMKKFFSPKSVHFPLFTKIAIVALFLSQFSSRKKFLREDKTDCGMK